MLNKEKNTAYHKASTTLMATLSPCPILVQSYSSNYMWIKLDKVIMIFSHLYPTYLRQVCCRHSLLYTNFNNSWRHWADAVTVNADDSSLYKPLIFPEYAGILQTLAHDYCVFNTEPDVD